MTDDIRAKIREEQRRQRRSDRKAAMTFVEACKAGDAERVYDLAEHLGEETLSGWSIAIGKIANERPDLSPHVREALLAYWAQHRGSSMGLDHKALRIALRVMMPPYSGSAMRVYRGASANERRRRIYGFSWTSDISIAQTLRSGGQMLSRRQCADGNCRSIGGDHLCNWLRRRQGRMRIRGR
jgi:hypothetical protein